MSDKMMTYEDLPREDQQRVAEEIGPRVARVFGFLQEAFNLEPGVPAPEEDVSPADWRRLANRKLDEATDNGEVDWEKLDEARKLGKAAEMQEALNAAKEEVRYILAFSEAFQKEVQERQRAEEVRRRHEARAKGDAEASRAVNRARHKNAPRVRAKKK